MLYHYTSLTTLCAIVNGIQDGNLFLRASNAKQMNDPNDCYYFVNIIGQIKRWDKYKIDTVCAEKEKFDTPYLISLSKLKDDLYMWNCYGENGKGIVLGFDKKKLEEAIDNFYSRNHIFARLYPCKYFSASQIKNSIALSEIIKEDINENYWQRDEIKEISNIIKHPGYKYEQEYRIVIKHALNEYTFTQIYKLEEDAFYIPVPVDAIKNITAGPNANIEAIKKIFSNFFPKAKFERSLIPYRSK